MDFNEYNTRSRALAIYPGVSGSKEAITYCALGLSGEAGEVADKVKKVLRDAGGDFEGIATRVKITAELGDVLWYLTQLAYELGASLEDVAQANLAKLESRKVRGVLGGSGDAR